jgi:DNA-binding LacI/PurR family transcriptional regulator
LTQRKNMPTSYDVAREAGVSQSAVSYVLSGAKGAARIPPETRQRIFEAARKLDYRRNSTGAALRRGYSDTVIILAVSWEVAVSHSSEAIAVSAAASKRGLNTNVQVAADDQAAHAFLDNVLSFSPFGLLLVWDTPELPRDKLLGLMDAGLPVVDLLPSTIDEIPSATASRRQGMRSAVEYLISMGHREIGMLLDTTIRAKSNLEKLRGYREGLEQAGIDFDEDLLQEFTGVDFEAGQAAFEALRGRMPGFTAVICTNDGAALGAIFAAKKMGLDVPGDISVIGHGNNAGCSWFSPTLTSLSVPSSRTAENAVHLIEAMRLEEGFKPRSMYEREELAIRESTGPVRGFA